MRFSRMPVELTSDPRRVILRPFGDISSGKARRIVDAVLAMSMAGVEQEIAVTLRRFGGRHGRLEELLDERGSAVLEGAAGPGVAPGAAYRMLIGALFLMEYAVEAAALFNPSIAPHPDVAAAAAGKFILALRATGEGHISSIEFREGSVSADGTVSIDPPASPLTIGHRSPPHDDATGGTLSFDPRTPVSSRVIFPGDSMERSGIEDARFVRFEDRSGESIYLATYTAWDGHDIVPRILRTPDFVTFDIVNLRGSGAVNKGMALFPRRIGSRYAMISRQDNENLFLMYSDDLSRWEERGGLLQPKRAWEMVQIGNCGSPIETDEGWLLLTHGVGPMRRYCIGAVLLDLEDPGRVIGRAAEPLLEPEETEREGYVPNVVYTCGAMVCGERLVMPYAASDSRTRFASVSLDELLASLTGN